jgi:hypothetical protein
VLGEIDTSCVITTAKGNNEVSVGERTKRLNTERVIKVIAQMAAKTTTAEKVTMWNTGWFFVCRLFIATKNRMRGTIMINGERLQDEMAHVVQTTW